MCKKYYELTLESSAMRNIASMLCLLILAAGLSGCVGGNGTEISTEGEPIVQGELPDDWPTYSVATMNDLPTCDSTTLGRLYYVESPAQFQVCKSTGWATLDLSQLNVLQNSFPSMTVLSESTAAVDDNDGTWSADVELEILALDIDGYISSLGVDLNMDGSVDVNLTSTLGLGTTITNPAHLNVTFSMPYEQALYATQERLFSPYCHLRLQNVFAIVIGDDDGGITTELVKTSSVGELPGFSSMMVNGFNSYGILDSLQVNSADRAWLNGSATSSPCSHLPEFSITDHTDSLTSASGDNLVRIEITSANDISSMISGVNADFTPSISEPNNCGYVVTFDGADESDPQTGDAWVISEANNANGDLCAPNSNSTVVVRYGSSGMGPYGLAYQEVILS